MKGCDSLERQVYLHNYMQTPEYTTTYNDNNMSNLTNNVTLPIEIWCRIVECEKSFNSAVLAMHIGYSRHPLVEALVGHDNGLWLYVCPKQKWTGTVPCSCARGTTEFRGHFLCFAGDAGGWVCREHGLGPCTCNHETKIWVEDHNIKHLKECDYDMKIRHKYKCIYGHCNPTEHEVSLTEENQREISDEREWEVVCSRTYRGSVRRSVHFVQAQGIQASWA